MHRGNLRAVSPFEKILLANSKASNEPSGEAGSECSESRNTHSSARDIGQPGTGALEIDGGGDDEMLQMRLCLNDVTRAAQIRGAPAGDTVPSMPARVA